jgi:hypothetical protein
VSAKIKVALSLCVLALSTSVGAEPIRYDLILASAYGSGPSGTASFYWDRSSGLVSSFRWDFGWGNDADGNYVPFTGGIDDSSGYWTPDNSGYLFEILTGYNVHTADCEQPGDCGIHFGDGQDGHFGTLPWGVEFGNEREGAGFWAGFANDVFSTGPVTTSGACEPGMATARLRGEVTFSLPRNDVAWGRAPAGSPVITQVTYDRCSLGSYRGYGAIVGDFEGSLMITFLESSFTEQDDFFYWEPDPGGFGARSPWATFSGPDLVGLDFYYYADDQYLDIEGLAFEGWVDDELVLAGTLRAVPLPGTLPLLCLGLFGLAVTRRKAHRASHAGS